MQFPRLNHFFADAMHLFYPHLCVGCGSDLLGKTDVLCLKCISSLPHTGYELYAHNPVEQLFEGRIKLQAAHSAFYFSKGQLVQKLIHELKYKNNRAAGEWLGFFVGEMLLSSARFAQIDYLVPLPMFHAKERKRGYNQATVICEGLSKAMQVPVNTNLVLRRHATETQTRKHRMERWTNAEGSFVIPVRGSLKNKHVLLVDDVLTTGATLEACARAMLQEPKIKLSIATLALANK